MLTKWLHNKDWMPVSSTGMTPSWIEINVTHCPVHVSYKH
nr:WPE palindromic element domain-containing protein [Wolbachia endosymbiont (group A) of Anomoia purmunda]